MTIDVPLYALQRSAPDRWLIWTPDPDPRMRWLASSGAWHDASAIVGDNPGCEDAHEMNKRLIQGRGGRVNFKSLRGRGTQRPSKLELILSGFFAIS